MPRTRARNRQRGRPSEAHHRLPAALIETAPDSSVDGCIGRESVADECVLDIFPLVRVAARQSEVEQPRARRRGEVEDTEARKARPAPELRCPLVLVKRN